MFNVSSRLADYLRSLYFMAPLAVAAMRCVLFCLDLKGILDSIHGKNNLKIFFHSTIIGQCRIDLKTTIAQ